MRIRAIADNFWSVAFFCSFITGFIAIVSYLTRRRRHYFRLHRLVNDVHYLWPFDQYLIQPTLCNVCSTTLLTGFHCLSCGIYLHERCVRPARRLFHCKHMTSQQEPTQHQWTRGNLPLDSECVVCRRPCGAEPRLCDYRCIWCQRIVHDSCMRALPNECDLGEFQRLIVPVGRSSDTSSMRYDALLSIMFNSMLYTSPFLPLTLVERCDFSNGQQTDRRLRALRRRAYFTLPH